ncbi:hypothetical protein B0H14DRAFT_3167603 [Mycena olivaceomarginata]|nr:hypothetical protein B0H14DRAFT_3167603 [Mycena olivaceomarginata]
MRSLLVPLLLGTVVPVSLASSPSEIKTTESEACSVHAWVRAEDLSPNHISRGELRIKVPRPECAHEIASVTLRLQLNEFGEFKYLKNDAVLPAVQATNQSAPDGYADWVGSDIVYDYQAYDNALVDPELWTVKAEERRAWTTEATLVDNNPDLSQPTVTAFTVAVPAVNYPPVFGGSSSIGSLSGLRPVFRHSSSDLDYRYIAVVTFVDGRTENVLAGHTTFVPSSRGAIQQTPLTQHTAFETPDCRREDSPASKKHAEDLERCLPESQRSAFIAEIHLEEGNIVYQGQPLKGRVTVRNIKDGSTSISSISVRLRSRRSDHWAQAHADAGGDANFYNATSGLCQFNVLQALNAESSDTEHIFADNDDEDRIYRYHSPRSSTRESITPAHPYFDFELQIPHETPVDFASYYTAIENHLHFDLTVLYSLDVAKCINPDSKLLEEEPMIDYATNTEEGLWDSYTRVGQPLQSTSHYWGSLTLQAEVAITVVGGIPPAHPVKHYLSPGALAPILRSGAQAQMPDMFPVAQPIFTEEALANTSARLMQAGSTDPFNHLRQQFMNMTRLRWLDSHPTKDYRRGNYAGLLWKKKVVAVERGILPVVERGEGGSAFSAAS